MTTALQPVRGTHDVLPEEARQRRFITDTARTLAERYGFGEIITPIFEFTEVFSRTLGDTSDVVTKEMYSFTDRGGESLTLRPEWTAAVVRAFIHHGPMQQALPQRLFYAGPAFRYERPQKGRLRQFHQIGVEVLGASEPLADVECVALAADILAALGLAGDVTLEINSLGDPASRMAYREALVKYLSGHEAKFSADSKTRLHKNPLRVLDSKDEGDREVVAGAPLLEEYYTPEARSFWHEVLGGLKALGVAYRLNPVLVRGLDYYNHTAFEFVTHQLGAQGTVLAGGRYDGLSKQMGGPDVAGIGWAAGLERLLALAEPKLPALPFVVLVPLDEKGDALAPALAHRLRAAGLTVQFDYGGKPGKRLKRASERGASHAVLLGGDELAQQAAAVKNFLTGVQETIALEALPGWLKSSMG